MSLDLFFDYLAVRLDGQRAEGRRLVIDWVFADLGQRYVLNLENGALTYLADRRSERPDATVTLERAVLTRLLLRELAVPDAVAEGRSPSTATRRRSPISSASSTTLR